MSDSIVLVENATPVISIQSQNAITVDDQANVVVETRPDVVEIKWLGFEGAPGVDGADADFSDPATVSDMLVALSGQITGSMLHSTLLNSINKIDVGPTSLEAQAALLQYADSQLNAAIAADSARITAAETSISDIDGQLLLFGSDLTTLDGRITGNSAAIDSIETRVTANESDIVTQSQTIQGISSRVDIVESDLTAQSAIVNQNTSSITVLDGDITSVAETLSTITAGVGGMTAAIQLKNEVIAGTTTPLYAQHTIKLDVNGKISGYGIASTETGSVFEILADRFAVTNGLNNGIIPFIVDGADVYIQNGFIQNAAIDTARIADASITTAKIQDAQITNAKIADAEITGAKIATATIDTANIKDAAIVDAKIGNLSAEKITAGSLALNWSGGAVYSGKTSYGGTSPGFWLGNNAGTPSFDIGNSTNYIRWDGSSLAVGGNIIASGNIQSGAVSTQARFSNRFEVYLSGNYVWGTIAVVTITVAAGQTVEIATSFEASLGNDANLISIRVARGTTIIYGYPEIGSTLSSRCRPEYYANIWAPNTITLYDEPGAGTFSYYMQAGCHSGGVYKGFRNRFMTATILKC